MSEDSKTHLEELRDEYRELVRHHEELAVNLATAQRRVENLAVEQGLLNGLVAAHREHADEAAYDLEHFKEEVAMLEEAAATLSEQILDHAAETEKQRNSEEEELTGLLESVREFKRTVHKPPTE